MTAEERAEGTADEMRDECDDDVSMAGREIIAKHIAAAEDEALERAATSIEQRALTHGAWTSALGTAKRIRSLKFGPGVSGKDGR